MSDVLAANEAVVSLTTFRGGISNLHHSYERFARAEKQDLISATMALFRFKWNL